MEVTSFHVDMRTRFEAFGAAKQTVFGEAPYPSWTAIGVSGLADPALLAEIKVVAKLP
mgnify:FL=1